MKKLLFVFLFFISSFFAHAQTGGFVNLNDFGLPTNPYQHSRFWLRGSTPAGSNPILEFYGLSKSKLYTDTIQFTKLQLREDASPYKLVWIDNTGMLRAFTPNYMIVDDTAAALSGYLRVADTTGKWLPVGTFIPPIQVNSDWNSVSGLSQILNKPTIPSAQVSSDWNSVVSPTEILNKPRLGTPYLGTTNGSGDYTVVYSTPYSVTPDVQPQLQVGNPNQGVYITSSTTTGFTVHAFQRAVLPLLGLDLLAGNPTNLTGVSVSVLVTAR